jgi:hypothetical protein
LIESFGAPSPATVFATGDATGEMAPMRIARFAASKMVMLYS